MQEALCHIMPGGICHKAVTPISTAFYIANAGAQGQHLSAQIILEPHATGKGLGHLQRP